jgi:hypothetical protein
MQSPRALLVMIVSGASLLIAAACGGSKGQTCAQGTERCPCYGNSTCNPGLTCASNECVNLGGAGGISGGGGQGGVAGNGATGGSNVGGTGGASSGGNGGTTVAGTSGAGTGGKGGATGGGGGTGTAGTTGSGGSTGSCTNTATDPNNCGTCGHVCKNADPIYNGGCPTGGCCAAGACGPALGACITQHDGFATCAAYCASIGETCVQRGCVPGSLTAAAWAESDRCQIAFNNVDAFSTGACDAPLGLQDGTSAAFGRCCCTDTH